MCMWTRGHETDHLTVMKVCRPLVIREQEQQYRLCMPAVLVYQEAIGHLSDYTVPSSGGRNRFEKSTV